MKSQPKVVNVSSVPKLSPFRYPGGKTWLVPYLRAWLKSLPHKPATSYEPFTGGGIISLTVAFEQLANHVVMVELDESVAAVWQTILSDDAKWLADMIVGFDVSVETVRAELDRRVRSTKRMAFHTILRNRTYHGGIMAHGSGLIKHGENGKGIKSRWYPETLRKRIMEISGVRERITFIQGDALTVMRDNASDPTAIWFIDPPYTAAGKKAGTRLYKYNELDHEALFDIAATLKGDFLMTYDNAEGVVEMAQRRGFDTATIPMKNTHHATMNELVVGRNLEWARKALRPAQEQPLLF